jgi:hypothetical protein
MAAAMPLAGLGVGWGSARAPGTTTIAASARMTRAVATASRIAGLTRFNDGRSREGLFKWFL